jgi:predicted DNA-binding protein
MSDTVQLDVLVLEELRKRAKVVAAQQGHTLSDVIRESLEEQIARLEDAEIGPRAQAAFAEWVQAPSSARPWREFEAELIKDGLLDEQTGLAH